MESLLIGILELPKGKKPNFKKARAALAKMSERECAVAFSAATNDAIDPDDEENGDFYQRRCLDALNIVEAGWLGDRTDFTTHETLGDKSTQLITALNTWGDSNDALDAVWLFYEAGLAEVAGFCVSKPARKKSKSCHASTASKRSKSKSSSRAKRPRRGTT